MNENNESIRGNMSKTKGFSGSYEDLTDKPNLSKVATSGSYKDLSDKLIIEQYYKENDNPISGLGVKDALKQIAPSGSGSPITVLDYYPSNEKLEEMGEGIYLAKVADYTSPDYLCFFSTREDWGTYDNVTCKYQSWTVTIISHNGVRVERKDRYFNFDDGRPEINIDWREVPLNDTTATKEYVDNAIGDIETSLENIIAKYGLGGGNV